MRYHIRTLVLVALAAVPAAAEDDYRDARIYDLEPGVVLQRATESSAEEAVVNLPFLPGDRVWTDASGRADFQFQDGTRLRLDSRSKVDYTSREEARRDQVSLRLWSGGIYLHVRGGADHAAYEIETPGGLVEADEEGVYRLDVDSGETRLTVYEGEATLDAGRRRVKVEAGSRAYARRGEAPERPSAFDEGEADEFARWDQEREQQDARSAASRRYLPDELDAYAPDLERNGTWYYETEVGYVWRPRVAAGWQPYSNGRWVWTNYGWTWVPGERWGWAPSHYGRWGNSGALGWYWIPGNTWGPAWVSWASGGDYVGWCALGRYDRPVFQPRRNGYAVARGSVGAGSAWRFTRRSDLSARDGAHRRLEIVPEAVSDLRIGESPRVRPSRDGRELREGSFAVPRNVRVKPTPGDSVRELQRDNQTQVGVGPLTPNGRRRRDEGARNDEREDGRPPRVREGGAAPAPEGARAAPRPTDVRAPSRTGRVVAEPRSPEAERDGRSGRDRGDDAERDVLRRMFRPLSEPRAGRSGDGASATDERRTRQDGARPREDAARPRDEGARSRDENRPQSRDDNRGQPRDEGFRRTPRSEDGGRARESSPPPRSQPREASPRSEPRSAAPRNADPPRASAPPPRSEPRSSSGGASARPRRERE